MWSNLNSDWCIIGRSANFFTGWFVQVTFFVVMVSRLSLCTSLGIQIVKLTAFTSLICVFELLTRIYIRNSRCLDKIRSLFLVMPARGVCCCMHICDILRRNFVYIDGEVLFNLIIRMLIWLFECGWPNNGRLSLWIFHPSSNSCVSWSHFYFLNPISTWKMVGFGKEKGVWTKFIWIVSIFVLILSSASYREYIGTLHDVLRVYLFIYFVVLCPHVLPYQQNGVREKR